MAKNHGLILINVLLILIATILLALTAFNSSLLATKVNNNYWQRWLAFNKTEHLLRIKEQWLRDNQQELPPAILKISTAVCGITFYRIVIIGSYHNITQSMQSTFAIRGDTSHCKPPPTITTGRQSWR